MNQEKIRSGIMEILTRNNCKSPSSWVAVGFIVGFSWLTALSVLAYQSSRTERAMQAMEKQIVIHLKEVIDGTADNR